MDHLRRSFRRDVGENMDAYLKQSIPLLITRFLGTKEDLQEVLFEEIED